MSIGVNYDKVLRVVLGMLVKIFVMFYFCSISIFFGLLMVYINMLNLLCKVVFIKFLLIVFKVILIE